MKKALMTGATSGFGIFAAYELLQQGFELWVIARSNEKIDALKDGYEKLYPSQEPPSIKPLIANLNSIAEVQSAIVKYSSDNEHLDLLINNAGLWNSNFEETDDGIEETLHVNLVAPFQLMIGLIGQLERAAYPVIINTASGLHQGSIDFDNLHYRQNFSGFKAYRQSKLGIILITRMMAQTFPKIVTVSQHPGLVSTNLGRNLGWIGTSFFKFIGMSAENGAETLIHLLNSDPNSLVSGEFYAKSKVKKTTPESYDMLMAGKLIEELKGMLSEKT